MKKKLLIAAGLALLMAAQFVSRVAAGDGNGY